jgi:hypothetical protein
MRELELELSLGGGTIPGGWRHDGLIVKLFQFGRGARVRMRQTRVSALSRYQRLVSQGLLCGAVHISDSGAPLPVLLKLIRGLSLPSAQTRRSGSMGHGGLF